MRKEMLLFMLLGEVLTMLTGCRDENGTYVSEIENGGFFLRDNTVRFYYIDEQGNDLIRPGRPETLPITYTQPGEVPATMSAPADYKKGTYNQGLNTIGYDEKEKLYYMHSIVPGDSRQKTYTFYIGHQNQFDKVEITYEYTTDNVYGWSYWSRIVSWKYNNVPIYSDSDKYDKKIFIKKARGKTTVSFTR
ncbi:MAG: hypothetical protein LUG98_14385 [Tannerellaceae bacterium]|nr:hypothetical protein [Tannerellaceae bacterium]